MFSFQLGKLREVFGNMWLVSVRKNVTIFCSEGPLFNLITRCYTV